ncbi:hypothetical protein VOLCADRAFT_100500 [Volvox carteri f. nagariensis]|uniref:BZIP domain-containing protein n=1 Tax=Volvox carteri f. nagariensis TaxID=3068 RepID=D8UKC3_VOLCA|nr:uncharacterized protein VOLCADRAFT_100500 [Volvox carteri f. nagariensis]EFJ39839.1 hypothetical protein VOLCADRAFT_100500 [Volvox carteri f. nagariensis]|eukprot:XP_002959111.1 hypothetical protein VOLCADRAFT_100500 [Volvox carteri f. nagariensis]
MLRIMATGAILTDILPLQSPATVCLRSCVVGMLYAGLRAHAKERFLHRALPLPRQLSHQRQLPLLPLPTPPLRGLPARPRQPIRLKHPPPAAAAAARPPRPMPQYRLQGHLAPELPYRQALPPRPQLARAPMSDPPVPHNPDQVSQLLIQHATARGPLPLLPQQRHMAVKKAQRQVHGRPFDSRMPQWSVPYNREEFVVEPEEVSYSRYSIVQHDQGFERASRETESDRMPRSSDAAAIAAAAAAATAAVAAASPFPGGHDQRKSGSGNGYLTECNGYHYGSRGDGDDGGTGGACTEYMYVMQHRRLAARHLRPSPFKGFISAVGDGGFEGNRSSLPKRCTPWQPRLHDHTGQPGLHDPGGTDAAATAALQGRSSLGPLLGRFSGPMVSAVRSGLDGALGEEEEAEPRPRGRAGLAVATFPAAAPVGPGAVMGFCSDARYGAAHRGKIWHGVGARYDDAGHGAFMPYNDATVYDDTDISLVQGGHSRSCNVRNGVIRRRKPFDPPLFQATAYGSRAEYVNGIPYEQITSVPSWDAQPAAEQQDAPAAAPLSSPAAPSLACRPTPCTVPLPAMAAAVPTPARASSPSGSFRRSGGGDSGGGSGTAGAAADAAAAAAAGVEPTASAGLMGSEVSLPPDCGAGWLTQLVAISPRTTAQLITACTGTMPGSTNTAVVTGNGTATCTSISTGIDGSQSAWRGGSLATAAARPAWAPEQPSATAGAVSSCDAGGSVGGAGGAGGGSGAAAKGDIPFTIDEATGRQLLAERFRSRPGRVPKAMTQLGPIAAIAKDAANGRLQLSDDELTQLVAAIEAKLAKAATEQKEDSRARNRVAQQMHRNRQKERIQQLEAKVSEQVVLIAQLVCIVQDLQEQMRQLCDRQGKAWQEFPGLSELLEAAQSQLLSPPAQQHQQPDQLQWKRQQQAPATAAKPTGPRPLSAQRPAACSEQRKRVQKPQQAQQAQHEEKEEVKERKQQSSQKQIQSQVVQPHEQAGRVQTPLEQRPSAQGRGHDGNG